MKSERDPHKPLTRNSCIREPTSDKYNRPSARNNDIGSYKQFGKPEDNYSRPKRSLDNYPESQQPFSRQPRSVDNYPDRNNQPNEPINYQPPVGRQQPEPYNYPPQNLPPYEPENSYPPVYRPPIDAYPPYGNRQTPLYPEEQLKFPQPLFNQPNLPIKLDKSKDKPKDVKNIPNTIEDDPFPEDQPEKDKKDHSIESDSSMEEPQEAVLEKNASVVELNDKTFNLKMKNNVCVTFFEKKFIFAPCSKNNPSQKFKLVKADEVKKDLVKDSPEKSSHTKQPKEKKTVQMKKKTSQMKKARKKKILYLKN
ncbi:hypothetical protein EDEG_01886 [Edhazardia aedis USNM 41457]|uniref:Uncharacterized protein n=1 Tax=Edhazardia aedis (strain USNM 41457) TaxID=1003232 RepID=J8ZVX9_EDHAE|nr:hypothetical protein EDEG_01886 [Edhazardia aedis USNM 41457]|eukprot:EJW03828.1 hypothetical protein EDEG_01886 [Edhazardia aedis USNM 41457]